MAEIVDQLVLQIDQALRQIDQIEQSLDRAIAPIEVEVDTTEVRDLEESMRRVERAASDVNVETAAIALKAGDAEVNFEELARALNISEDAARRLTGEVLEARSAAIRLEEAARDVARQLDLSEDEAARLTRELRIADRAAADINVTTGGMVAGFGNLRTAVAGVAGALAAIGGAQLLSGALRGANAAIQSFATLQDSINAVNVVFGDASAAVINFGEEAARSAGLSQQAFNQAVVPIGALLQNFGFDANTAAGAAVTLVQRGADLASVYGGTVQDALLAVGAALRGEADPLERYGASISAARVQAFALAEGLARNTAELTPAVLLQARYQLILSDTARVAGDYANTADDLANAQRTAAGEVQNFVDSIGEQLAPAFESILVLVPEVIEGLRQLVPAFATGAEGVADFFESVGEGGGFRTELSLIGAGFDIVTSGAGLLGEAAALAFDGLRGDSEAARNSLGRFTALLQGNVARGIGAALARDLDAGTEGVDAFSTALSRVSRNTSSFDVFKNSFREFAIAGGLTKLELRDVTTELINNRDQLGLTGDEVEFLTDQVTLLNDALFPSIESIREFNRAARESEGESAPIVTTLQGIQQSAADAGISLTDLVTANGPVAAALATTLTPAQNTALAFEAIRTESGGAAAIFSQTVRPAIADVGQALEDLNADGKVTRDEFVKNLQEMAAAQLEFTAAIATIAVLDADTAVKLATLPIDQALDAVRQIAADPANAQQVVEAIFGTQDQFQAEVLNLFNIGVPSLFSGVPRLTAGFITAVTASITDDAKRRQVEAALTAVLDPALAVSFADLDIPDVGPQIEEALSQPEAARGGARVTIDAFARDLINELAAERFNIQGDIQDEMTRILGGLDIGVDFGQDGLESGTTFIDGFIEAVAAGRSRVRTAITQTLNSAIERSSPPQLFVDAGIESGDAFWTGFEQADMTMRLPAQPFTGSVTGTAADTAAVGGGYTFAPTYINTETRDLETVVARSEQTQAAVSGLLGKIKFV